MNRLLRFAALAAISAGGFLALTPVTAVPAEAAACVRGVRAAACAGPRGAVVVPARRTTAIVR